MRKFQTEMLGRSLVALIAGVFVASAIMRGLGIGGVAMANTPEPVGDIVETPLQACSNPIYVPILDALRAREAEVVRKEAEIVEAAQVMQSAKASIHEKLTELKHAEQQLRETIAQAQTAAESDVTQLTQVYENMKAKDAAALFQKMDAEFAAGFLGRMSPKVAAEIMTGLDADHAYAVSVLLAGRNMEIPLE